MTSEPVVSWLGGTMFSFSAFASKWLQGDRFTLNFTGAGRGKENDSFNTVEDWYERRVR